MANQLLRVSGLSAGTEDKPILHNVSLTVGAGETHVLMGPNGAGKTSLIKCLITTTLCFVTSTRYTQIDEIQTSFRYYVRPIVICRSKIIFSNTVTNTNPFKSF